MLFFTENMSVNNALELNKSKLFLFDMQRMQLFLLDEMHLLMQLSNVRQLTRFWNSFHQSYRNKIFFFSSMEMQTEN
jgi:hypothetical protein